MKEKVIVICGPTASGKTALSIDLAKKINGEIISADSMQIYKDMDIGTAKPTKEEMQGIKHYLLDFVSPEKRYSVAQSKQDAKTAIKENKKSVAKVLIAPMTENIEKALEVATVLRNNEINTEIYLENKKIKAKFKYADKLQIPYVITIGEEEIMKNTVALKNMETGEQQELSIEEAVKILK